jgi:hypothetical protein
LLFLILTENLVLKNLTTFLKKKDKYLKQNKKKGFEINPLLLVVSKEITINGNLFWPTISGASDMVSLLLRV